MTDPPRLTEQGDGEAASLIRAARSEAPSGRAMQRTVATLSAGAALLASGKGAAGAVTGVQATALLIGKWVSVGAVGGAALALGVHAMESDRDMAAPSQVESRSVAAAQPTAARGSREVDKPTAPRTEPPETIAPSEPVVEAPEAHPEPAPLPAHASPRAPEPPATNVAPASDLPPPTAVDPETALEREIRFVDAARAALARGAPAEALSELRRYRSEASSRRLAPEALYLEMEAHAVAGASAAAVRAAEELLVRYPNGPHSSRARELLGRDQASP